MDTARADARAALSAFQLGGDATPAQQQPPATSAGAAIGASQPPAPAADPLHALAAAAASASSAGRCAGRVKRVYAAKEKYNVECKYEDGDVMDHKFGPENYVGAAVPDGDLDASVAPGCWVLVEEPQQ